jgi:hypothetical protein
MHNRAYKDDGADAVFYQPLRAEKDFAVYSEAQSEGRPTIPAELRKRGKTREAAVHGRTVAFMRLSSSCKVYPVPRRAARCIAGFLWGLKAG